MWQGQGKAKHQGFMIWLLSFFGKYFDRELLEMVRAVEK
jgi:hypothetical protein